MGIKIQADAYNGASTILFLQYFLQNMDEQAVATFPSGLSFKCVSLTQHCQLPS